MIRQVDVPDISYRHCKGKQRRDSLSEIESMPWIDMPRIVVCVPLGKDIAID
jgi:hypothetical protein